VLKRFDARQAGQQRAGDLSLAEVGRDTQLPWQVDGRCWHTRDRLSHRGRPCRWEGGALGRVVDAIEADARFAPINWNDRSVVEVTAPGAPTWFLHALTGDEWLLALRFRVERNTFREEALQAALDLRPVDDLDDLPVYGRGERVRVKNLRGPWQEVSVTVHWLREIETPAFDRFLAQAIEAYHGQARAKRLDMSELTPWKVLGRKWHLSRKGFPGSKKVEWPAEMLEDLFAILEQALVGAAVDWGGRQQVAWRRAAGALWVTVSTKRRAGVELKLYCRDDEVSLGRIASLGTAQKISAVPRGGRLVSIWLTTREQVTGGELPRFLTEFAHRSALAVVS
jgi:excinuclease ABC subunit A